jgi:hypothetical protein
VSAVTPICSVVMRSIRVRGVPQALASAAAKIDPPKKIEQGPARMRWPRGFSAFLGSPYAVSQNDNAVDCLLFYHALITMQVSPQKVSIERVARCVAVVLPLCWSALRSTN